MARTSQASVMPAFMQLASHPLRWKLLNQLGTGDLRVRELVTLIDEPQNLLSYHLRHLRDGGLVSARRSDHDGRDSYYHLDLDRCAAMLTETATALHPSLAAEATVPQHPARGRPHTSTVLFVCTGNSIRSPIAEALARHHGGDGVSVTSAGTRPRRHLHPDTIRVLSDEYGIDIAGQRPRDLATVAGRRVDRVVTLCDRARENLPAFDHHPRRTHWSVAEPATVGGHGRTGYRELKRIAADIDIRVRHLLPILTPTRH